MKNRNICYLVLFLIFSASFTAIAQLPEEQRLHEIEEELNALNHRLSQDLNPEERGHLEQRSETLLAERRDLEEHLNRLRPGDGKLPPNDETNKNFIRNPVVIAAIIGAIGVITAALIGLKKRDQS
jgi:hypothetical protein